MRRETNPDDLNGMIAAQGILTSRGGKISHAAVVARGMGKTCVCGPEDFDVDTKRRRLTASGGGTVFQEGDVISVDGSSGLVVLRRRAGGRLTGGWNTSRAPSTRPRRRRTSCPHCAADHGAGRRGLSAAGADQASGAGDHDPADRLGAGAGNHPDRRREGARREPLDVEGVGELVEIATERGRATRPGLKVGVCGEHGGDPNSVHFFHRAGLLGSPACPSASRVPGWRPDDRAEAVAGSDIR